MTACIMISLILWDFFSLLQFFFRGLLLSYNKVKVWLVLSKSTDQSASLFAGRLASAILLPSLLYICTSFMSALSLVLNSPICSEWLYILFSFRKISAAAI